MSASILTPGLRPAAKLMKALSNEARLLILCELGQGERSVGQLGAIVGLSQSALSQHLARLRADGLVRTRRRSQTIFYSIASREVTAVIEVLADLFCRAPDPSGESGPSCGAAVTNDVTGSVLDDGTAQCWSGPGDRSE
ncbi:MAG: ArsR/SmtB family transcription factor [Alphaproteobacteria bacterium]